MIIKNISNRIIPNGGDMAWLKSIIDRNAISTSALIESDTFGSLSDFNEDYSEANQLDQLYVLKAFLENEAQIERRGINFNVKEITVILKGWLDNVAAFERTVDSGLLKEKIAKRIPWTDFPAGDLRDIYKSLCRLTILEYMEKSLKDVEDNQELKIWLQTAKKELLNQSNQNAYVGPRAYNLFTGASSFKAMLQAEIGKILKFKAEYLEGAEQVRRLALHEGYIKASLIRTLVVGMQVASLVGSIALFPNRLLTTAFRECVYYSSNIAIRALAHCLPRHRTSQLITKFLSVVLPVSIFTYALFSRRLPFDLIIPQSLFPRFLGLEFMIKIFEYSAAVDLTARTVIDTGIYLNKRYKSGDTQQANDFVGEAQPALLLQHQRAVGAANQDEVLEPRGEVHERLRMA